MKNPDKRNHHQLQAWKLKGGVHDDQQKTAKQERMQAREDIQDQLEDEE